MSEIDGDHRRCDATRFPERLYIPSSVVSRIGSPTNNFIETPNAESAQLSFLETRAEVESTGLIMPGLSSENLEFSQSCLLKELENLRIQVHKINSKLDYNLTVLKEKQEKNTLLTSIMIGRSKEKEYKETTMMEEVNCSCSKGCQVF